MVCQKCEYCKKITEDKGVYTVSCDAKGSVNIHSDYEDRFNCEGFVERTTPIEPPKPNIMVILKSSGRDISVYDKRIASNKDLADVFNKYETTYLQFGNFFFRQEDIAVIGYIDE